MRFKGTLTLLVLCLALGGYLYFYEIKGGEKREKAKQAENQFWKVEGKDVQQIELSAPENNIIAARKGESEWQITAPRVLDADADELNRMADSASNIQREGMVESNATDLAKFGLAPPKSSLKIKVKDGREYRIDFGSDNPTGSSAYASVPGSKTVYLVHSYTARAFDKKLDDLRNRSVLKFEQPQAKTLTIRSPKGALHLAKDGDDRWWIEGEHRIAADSPGVRGMLNALCYGRVKEFLSGDPAEYANLGLENPFIDVTVTYGENKAIKRLRIGTEKSKLRKKTGKPEPADAERSSPEIYLAKDESRADLFFVEKELVDKLFKSADEVRDKALASFQRWDIDSIFLTNSKGAFTLAKSGGEWFLGESKKKARWEAVNGILDALEKPVKEWLNKPSAPAVYGLEKPAIRAVLKKGADVIIDCSLGKESKTGFYARIQGDPAVKVADPESFRKLDIGESDLAEPPAKDAKKSDSSPVKPD
jgi:hypothetical protein